MIRKIQHIGIAVRSLREAIPFSRDVLGLSLVGAEEGADQKIRAAVFRVGESTIEVIESTAPDGRVGKFMERNGEGTHHLCFEVGDAAAALSHAKGKGVRLIDETPRSGIHGMRIGFLHPKATFGVLPGVGGRWEPLLALLPERDRRGQIEALAAEVKRFFGKAPEGIWLAERVWEPDLPVSLEAAGVKYLPVDDYHFVRAGLV